MVAISIWFFVVAAIAYVVYGASAKPEHGCTPSMLQKKERRGMIHGLEQQEAAASDGQVPGTRPKFRIFYHIYKSVDETLAIDVVKEQMSALQSVPPNFYEVDFTTVGTPWDEDSIVSAGLNCFNCYHRGHYTEGWESITQQSLYEYCVHNPTMQVVYMHNKGSFHPGPGNDHLRRFLMKGITSDECVNMPDTCSVCSSRFSPFPYPHTSGNMWQAKCSHIQRLLPPASFEQTMREFLGANHEASPFNNDPISNGADRFSAEHWVHSHPDTEPCDLYDGNFKWGVSIDKDANASQGTWSPQLQIGMRLPIKMYVVADQRTQSLLPWVEWRCIEWRALYQKLPTDLGKWRFEELLKDSEGMSIEAAGKCSNLLLSGAEAIPS